MPAKITAKIAAMIAAMQMRRMAVLVAQRPSVPAVALRDRRIGPKERVQGAKLDCLVIRFV